ncbi:NAD(P)-binding protein [Echria macrotheca]|uniref:NAD(P)-binding protein n=1 Tax=Echria macrotheca TaxID=438768 RepID=A0AAJ0F2Z4_9PEZI|nr:NAD(P)-binding protein [Echria macrotheca]
MVKIAIAGGTGELGREVTEALVATGKHDITVLTRAVRSDIPGVTQRAVDYDDHDGLAQALHGIHTVLSFVNQLMEAPDKNCQKSLIDACISAGVKRFAPSEYGSLGKVDLPFWKKKKATREYLEQVNRHAKVLEYTLFQPGLLLDYLATPFKTSKYVTPLDTFIGFQDRRAIVVEGHEDAVLTLTAVRDIVGVVVQAVDYDGEWPRLGGVRGNRVTVSTILEVGARIRGRPFSVERVQVEDLERGRLNTSWSLGKPHPGFTPEQTGQMEAMLQTVLISILLSVVKEDWEVSDAWNKCLPDFRFTDIESFLDEVWKGKD